MTKTNIKIKIKNLPYLRYNNKIIYKKIKIFLQKNILLNKEIKL